MCFLWKNINLPQGSKHRVMEHPFLAQFRASSMRQKHRASSLWGWQRSWQPEEAPFYRWEQMPKPLQRPSSSHTSTPVALCLLVCDWIISLQLYWPSGVQIFTGAGMLFPSCLPGPPSFKFLLKCHFLNEAYMKSTIKNIIPNPQSPFAFSTFKFFP